MPLAAAACIGAGLCRRRPVLCLALAALATLGAGAAALSIRLAQATVDGAGTSVERTLEGRIQTLRRFDDAVRFDLVEVRSADAIPRAPRRVRVHARGLAPAFDTLAAGDTVRARLRLRAPRGARNPGGRDPARVQARSGIGAVGSLVDAALLVRIEAGQGPQILQRIHHARRRVSTALRRRGEGGALLAALGVGDRDGVARVHREAFARLGIAHLLAVSGLHLALVAGGCALLALRLSIVVPGLAAHHDPRRLAVSIALVSGGLYAVMAGWGVPVRRALLVLVAFVSATLRGRPVLRGEPLAGAALVVLAVEPGALFAPGAQLSFAASAALVWSRSEDRRGSGSWLSDGLGTSAVAIAATAPLAAYHFGGGSPAGLAINLFAIPWTAGVLLPAALGSVAASFVAGDAGWVDAVTTPAEILARATLVAVEHAAAALPSAPPRAPLPPVMLIGGLALGVAVTRTAHLMRRLVGVGLQAVWLSTGMPPDIAPGPPRAVFLDVGHGDAVLVEGHAGEVLVDGGGLLPGGGDRGTRDVVPALLALGVDRLALLVATHADADHRGGLPAVLASLPVGLLWLPPGGLADPAFRPVIEAARQQTVPIQERGRGDPPLLLGDLVIASLWPPHDRDAGLSRNDGSLVVRIEVAGRRVLVPGDIGARAEAALVASGLDLAAEVLNLPHHGSATSSSEEFLAAVRPQHVVASASCGGRFALPHAEVSARVRALGRSLAWTGRDGAVLIGLGAYFETRSLAGAADARRCPDP